MSTDYAFQPTKVGKQFQNAEEKGFEFAVIVDAQIADAVVEVKELKTREQVKVAAGDVAPYLQKLVRELLSNESKAIVKDHFAKRAKEQTDAS